MSYGRIAFVIALALGLSGGTAVAQVPGMPGPMGVAGEYTSDVTGNVIVWSPDWMLGTSDIQEVLRYDQTTWFSPADQAIVDIVFTAQDLEAASMRDEMVESFGEGEASIQIVDSGDYGDIAYALVILQIDEDVFGSFVLVNTSKPGGTGANLVAPIDMFGQAVEKTQGTLTIDYVPLLSGIDGPALQKQLEAAPHIDVDSTPEAVAQSADDTGFTSEEGGPSVDYPANWQVGDFGGDGNLEISNPDSSVTLSFMAVENPGLDADHDNLS